jgi:hypothetical protein
MLTEYQEIVAICQRIFTDYRRMFMGYSGIFKKYRALPDSNPLKKLLDKKDISTVLLLTTFFAITDQPGVDRRLQGLLQRRAPEDGLGPHGGA